MPGTDERELELKYRLRIKRIEMFGAVLNSVAKWGALLGCVYFASDTLKGIVGTTTYADVGIRFLGSLRISQSIGIAITSFSIFVALRERKLRHDKTEYLQGRIKKLEEVLDMNRSSSRITPRGTTRPEDQ